MVVDGVRCEEGRITTKGENTWVEAKKKYRLTDAHVQMAKELGMNPRKFGGLANHKQEPWKVPLPEFIEEIYYKRFRRKRPTSAPGS